MIPLSLAMLAEITQGKIVSAADEQTKNIESIVTDSRQLSDGDVFLALKGINFDGHKFCQ